MLGAAIDFSFAQSPLACVVIIVDAINPAAVSFYEKFRFVRFPDDARRLFLVRQSLAKYL